jgi:hypothetical protein
MSETFNYAEAAGQGTESLSGLGGRPFLKILQPKNAECDPTHRNYATKKIDGAKAGDIIFDGTGRIIPQPMEFIPFDSRSLYQEWRPLAAGGGFVGNHPLSIVGSAAYHKDTVKKSKEKLGDNELVFTTFFAVLFKDSSTNEWAHGVIAFTSSQLSKARALARSIANFRFTGALVDIRPPIFARSFLARHAIERNESGSWYGWNIEPLRVLDPTVDNGLLTSCQDALGGMSMLPMAQALPGPAKADESEAF